MGVIWNKVWFDVWGNKGRSLLVIFSIASGVFAVGAIFGMVDQLLSGMDQAHREIRPSHINVILRDYIQQDTINELREIPGVEDIEPVNQITIRYKVNPVNEWELGTLMERPDYDTQTYDLVTLKSGDWPDGNGLSVERMSSQFYGIDIGTDLILEVMGREESYPLTGIIRHPFVEPPTFGGQAHFFTDSGGLADFGIPDGYFGQLLVRIEDFSPENAQKTAGDIRSYLADQGLGVAVTLYQDPEEHWGRIFVEGVTLVLQVMAIVSLFLSVVIVFNTMTALITQQTDQIGVIKAVGGGRSMIILIYLAEVLLFSLSALIIAVPSSLAFAYFMSKNFLNLFNIDYEVFQYSTRALILQIIVGILIPILAASWPVFKGAMITVREAISSYGLGTDFGSSRLDRLIEILGARFLPTSYAASLGNMFRRKGRLVLTLLVLVIAGVMFLVTTSLVSSIQLTLDNETARQKFDIRVGLSETDHAADLLAIAESVPGVIDAQTWISLNAILVREGEQLQDSAGLGTQLIGIPPEDPMYTPIIIEGRWIEPGDDQVIVINQDTATKNGINVGDTLTLNLGDLGESQWQLIGTYKSVYGTGFDVEAIYSPIGSMQTAAALGDTANQVLLTALIMDLDEEEEFLNDLITIFENDGLQVDFYTTQAKLRERDYADSQFSTVIDMLINLSILIAVVGGIGLMGSLGISVVERTREIGVMRAIGGGAATIRSILIIEGVLQGWLSFLMAVPLAFFLAQPLARALGQTMLGISLDYAFNYAAVIIWLISITVIALLASILPSRNATRISVRESLAYA